MPIYNKKWNIKRIVLWGCGFIFLGLINVLVESILLPLWNLDNTEENDIYFISWWIVVGLWALFGIVFLKKFRRK